RLQPWRYDRGATARTVLRRVVPRGGRTAESGLGVAGGPAVRGERGARRATGATPFPVGPHRVSGSTGWLERGRLRRRRPGRVDPRPACGRERGGRARAAPPCISGPRAAGRLGLVEVAAPCLPRAAGA